MGPCLLTRRERYACSISMVLTAVIYVAVNIHLSQTRASCYESEATAFVPVVVVALDGAVITYYDAATQTNCTLTVSAGISLPILGTQSYVWRAPNGQCSSEKQNLGCDNPVVLFNGLGWFILPLLTGFFLAYFENHHYFKDIQVTPSRIGGSEELVEIEIS